MGTSFKYRFYSFYVTVHQGANKIEKPMLVNGYPICEDPVGVLVNAYPFTVPLRGVAVLIFGMKVLLSSSRSLDKWPFTADSYS